MTSEPADDADQERIAESIINLAQNAIQYTHTGDIITIALVVIKGKDALWG